MQSIKKACSILLVLCLLALPLVTHAAALTYGTPTSFNTGTTDFHSVGKLDSTHVIIAYTAAMSGRARIATIDGTGISLGTAYEFDPSVGSIDLAVLDSTHVIITYGVGTTGYAVIATISGTTISYGTPVQFATGLASGVKNSAVVALDSTHVAVGYITSTDIGGGQTMKTAYAIAATVSGNSISFGSSTTLDTNVNILFDIAVVDSTHIATLDTLLLGQAYVRIASVSGTTLSFGSAVQYSTMGYYGTFSALDSTHGIIAFRDENDGKGRALVATISGTSVSLGSATAFTSGTVTGPQVVALDSSAAVVNYGDGANSNYATARRLTVSAGSVSTDTASVYRSGSKSQFSDMLALDASTVFSMESTNVVVGTTDTTAPSAPSAFSATPSGSTMNLSWTNPVDADFQSVTIRRGTGTYPTTTTDGTSVVSGLATTSTSDTGLTDGTYYYSIFARDVRGNYSTAATVSATINTTASSSSSGGGGGVPASLILLRQQNGLDMWGNPLPQASSSSSSAASATSSSAASSAGNTSSSSLSISSSSSSAQASLPSAAKTPLQQRTCARVHREFSGNSLKRVAARILKILGFGC